MGSQMAGQGQCVVVQLSKGQHTLSLWWEGSWSSCGFACVERERWSWAVKGGQGQHAVGLAPIQRGHILSVGGQRGQVSTRFCSYPMRPHTLWEQSKSETGLMRLTMSYNYPTRSRTAYGPLKGGTRSTCSSASINRDLHTLCGQSNSETRLTRFYSYPTRSRTACGQSELKGEAKSAHGSGLSNDIAYHQWVSGGRWYCWGEGGFREFRQNSYQTSENLGIHLGRGSSGGSMITATSVATTSITTVLNRSQKTIAVVALASTNT